MAHRRKPTTLETEIIEWGLPDWDDPASYGDITKWDYERWRWEFYRRRADLRKHFDETVEDPSSIQYLIGPARERHEREGVICPNTSGFMVQNTETTRLFGYSGLPNPRISEQPKDAIKPYRSWFPLETIGPGAVHSKLGKSIIKAASLNLTVDQREFLKLTLFERYVAFIDDNELAIKFDLDSPITSQLKLAKELLDVKQIERHQRKITKRKHISKWFVYLRMLDAKPESLDDEITRPYFSELEKLLENKTKNPQSARDTLAQARALQFNI